VRGCPAGDPVHAAGWQSVNAMRPHLDEHVGGRLPGDIPQPFLLQNSLEQCVVCSRLLHRKFGGAVRSAVLASRRLHRAVSVVSLCSVVLLWKVCLRLDTLSKELSNCGRSV
jgi:hypothetical protein